MMYSVTISLNVIAQLCGMSEKMLSIIDIKEHATKIKDPNSCHNDDFGFGKAYCIAEKKNILINFLRQGKEQGFM